MEALIFIVAFGLAWGSFLNVVIFRLPEGLSLLKPRSFCRRCRTTIPFYDNIPLLSYIILRGTCRRCGARISPSYLLVEVLTPVCFLLIYFQFGLGVHFFAACLFSSGLIALGFIDFNHKILPDALTLPGFALALAYSFFRADLRPAQSLIGAAVGGGFLLLVYGVYYGLKKKEGLGLGDVTLMLMIGAFLGWRLTLLTLILASVAGAVVGIIIIVRKKKNLQYALPFGTFLAPAAFLALLWGETIVAAYLNLYSR
jgi:leader peptidase (prepilin peptidase)/N-methyltransferase